MMIEEKVFADLGLSEKEAQVYLALLELGSGTVGEIAKKANIKRPTVYVVLDELQKRGLVSKMLEGAKSTFIAEDPATLEKSVKQSLANYYELLPLFRAKYNRGKKPRIKYYEGKEALERLYLNEIFPSKELFFYGASAQKLSSILPHVIEVWQQRWQPLKNKRGERVRELMSSDPEDIKFAQGATGTREVRLIPKGMKFYADSVIADDKIFIISLENLFAISIESKDLAETYRTLVELAWQSAIPVDDWPHKK